MVQSTDETPNGPLELRVYPGPQCGGSLYLDDGHTFRYQQGEFLRQAFTCQSDSNSVNVKFGAREGTYTPWWKSVEVVIYDWPSAQAEAKLSNAAKPLKTTYDASAHALRIVIPDVAGNEELRVLETDTTLGAPPRHRLLPVGVMLRPVHPDRERIVKREILRVFRGNGACTLGQHSS